jgi:hypothetical protein
MKLNQRLQGEEMMDKRLPSSCAVAAYLILSALLLEHAGNVSGAFGPEQNREISTTRPSVRELSFKEFFEGTTGELKLSATLLQLNAKRVRLIGFMAEMENPPTGGFYLCPRPVSCDEEGGGTADLPPESIFVIVRSLNGKAVPFSPRALEVTGILEVGNRQESGGRVSFIRLVLDGPEEIPAASSSSSNSEK